jgi:hypothetical protein
MPRSEPRGQLLIVVAFGLVVLLAIAALVVDLGFSWMLRRQEQNAADPASIAAARWLKDSAGQPRNPFPEANDEACFYAQENGFFVCDPSCVTALAPGGGLEVHWPPISGPYAGAPGKVQVIITSTHPSFFAKIFGQDWATVSTSATAANEAGNSNSSSLVALQVDCVGGAAGQVSGGGTINIFPANASVPDGGYVQVNSSCGTSADDDCQNGAGSSALAISGTLITPYAYVNGSCTYNGAGASGLQCQDTSPCLDEDHQPPIGDPLAGIPEPNLNNFPNGICPDGTPSTPSSTSACELKKGAAACPDVGGSGPGICHLVPGVYYGGWDVKSQVEVRLDPGMYILAGGGIKLSGSSSIEAVDSATGGTARITIFSTDGPGCPQNGAQCQGSITFTAQQAFQAKATNTASCQAILATTPPGPNTCPWRGILLWQDAEGASATAAVKLGGQSSTIMSGTIYAPLAEVQINGGQDTTGCIGSAASCLSIQIISYRWKIDGNATVDMPYDPSELYQLDLRGLVH